VQDLRTKEELLFYLFVREMLLKCTVLLEDNLETVKRSYLKGSNALINMLIYSFNLCFLFV